MNDPVKYEALFLVGGNRGGTVGIAGPATRVFCHPEAFRNCVLVAWGRSTQRRPFFFRKQKIPAKKPWRLSLHVFFLVVLVSMWHEEKRMFWSFFFLGGGVVCEDGWLDLFWRVWWCFWVCSLDVFGWFLVNCRCFQFCKSHLSHEITLQKITPPSRLMAVKESFVVLVYLCSFAGSILFGIQQLRFFQRLDEQHDTHLNKK